MKGAVVSFELDLSIVMLDEPTFGGELDGVHVDESLGRTLACVLHVLVLPDTLGGLASGLFDIGRSGAGDPEGSRWERQFDCCYL
jgi:hypothetical protein